MTESRRKIDGVSLRVYTLNTVVVGSGAAGYNAADRLYAFGQRDIALITEHILAGTSRNTGSDKQTYYKLTLSGSASDSVSAMAETLFSGQCMDGDIALCEAALSAPCFLRLAQLGVPFPTNRFGAYIGYKTDHDPARRATSAGPLTSKLMTEALEKAVNDKGIPVFGGIAAVRVIVHNGAVRGVLCLDTGALSQRDQRFVLFSCKNIIWATGGPAGLYKDSVYPYGHFGASGMAFEAGVKGRNLTEWQYGLASTNPRWNVSGTYMQAMPRFISTDCDGGDAREFLNDFIPDRGALLDRIFLKGYEWPFDVRRAKDGSSLIDILVYMETAQKKRRVFLDYRENPFGGALDFGLLGGEAADYLRAAGAAFGIPLDRLKHMNAPAYDFFLSKGVDLAEKPLEIALCAQHNNGGLAVDLWWQTNVAGFFAAGEAAGSHGVYRPGGSALNAGQVGGTRAAMFISQNRRGDPEPFADACDAAVSEILHMAHSATGVDTVADIGRRARENMSRAGGAIRSREAVRHCLEETVAILSNFTAFCKIPAPECLPRFFRLRDMLMAQRMVLGAMLDYMDQGGASRGSALYIDDCGSDVIEGLPTSLQYRLDGGEKGGCIQEGLYTADGGVFTWRGVNPIPKPDDFFENVWRDYRENGNIY
ncbi:MAG: FAD-binding protein [Oscillospiraceae bacterium]|jgi:succinate dehydrogenase/fumarate reductase flavoprotein subunit|nr:FAD-binding protein [Oscillospiraceae bacterium]